MSNCANCKHWGTVAYEYYDEATDTTEEWDSGQVKAPHRICGAIKLVDGRPNVKAFVMDASRYRAELWTEAEFGCSLWEAKESDHEP